MSSQDVLYPKVATLKNMHASKCRLLLMHCHPLVLLLKNVLRVPASAAHALPKNRPEIWRALGGMCSPREIQAHACSKLDVF